MFFCGSYYGLYLYTEYTGNGLMGICFFVWLWVLLGLFRLLLCLGVWFSVWCVLGTNKIVVKWMDVFEWNFFGVDYLCLFGIFLFWNDMGGEWGYNF